MYTTVLLLIHDTFIYFNIFCLQVRCGCYYSIENSRPTRRRGRSQNYLWICTGDGISSHVTIFGQSTTASATCLKRITTFDLVETRVSAIEFIKGVSSDLTTLASDLVWMGTDSRRIIIYAAAEPEKEEEIGSYPVSGPVIEIKYHCDNVFVALGTGLLLLFRRQGDGAWSLKDPFSISLGNDPVSCLMPINTSVYAACGKKVWVLNATSGDITKSFSAQHEHVGNVKLMAHSGVGLWVALKNSSTVCLYHTETFKHLQDINIASNVLRVTKISNPANSCGNTLAVNNQTAVTVTALLACKGLLWVGTNVGISLTIPLPRLEGVPIISGRVNISYHAHFGPITFLLAIQNTKNTVHSAKERVNVDDESVQLRARDTEQRSRDRTSLDSSVSSNIVKLKQQLTGSPVMLRRKRSKEYDCRGSKTLPRGLGAGCGFLSSSFSSSQSSGENCDVYGLYGELMYVKDYENENNSGIDPIYESLRRSDPELAAIPNKVSTLDRRLKMKITRPRSLDLSNWSVDSHASSLYTSSGSEENLSLKTGKLSRNSSIASRNGPYDLSTPNNSVVESGLEATSATNHKANGKKNGKAVQQVEQPKRTVLTLMGGRGYVNWRQLHAQSGIDKNSKSTYAFKDPNSNDAHIVLWEMKL